MDLYDSLSNKTLLNTLASPRDSLFPAEETFFPLTNPFSNPHTFVRASLHMSCETRSSPARREKGPYPLVHPSDFGGNHRLGQCRNLIEKPWGFIRVPFMNPTILGL